MIGAGSASPWRQRFYAQVSVEVRDGAHHVLLDGRPLRTPRKAVLALPGEHLAEAIAGEWAAQGPRIDPGTMPLTRLANAAIDLVRGRKEAVVADFVAYAGSDLVCYRAEAPQGLVARQQARWDPVLAWAMECLGAQMRMTIGVMHVAQPEQALEKVRADLAACDAFAVAALHSMTALTGSALLALALAHGRLSADEAWTAAHVDEDWQISQWGEDAQAASRRASNRAAFDSAARMLALLRLG